MKKRLLNYVITPLLVTLSILVSGCGGNSSTTESKPIAYSPAPAAPAETVFNFPNSRNSYQIKLSGDTYAILDIASSTTTTLPTTKTSVKFSDFTVSLLAGEKSQTIATANLSSLIELYIAFFNRVPDAEGMIYWIGEIKAGKSIEQLADNFYTAAIAYSNVTGYSDTMSNSDFVKKIYKNVLGRDEVDTEGLNYWTNELNQKSKTRGNLIRTIISVAHNFKGDTQYGWVANLLDNKIAVGNYFSIQQGLNYNSSEESITKGIAIAALITPTDISAAKIYIGVTDNLDLRPPRISINTSLGSIIVQLNPAKAPITVANFLRYTDVGFYSNKIFHRVISNFMIQGGGLTTDMVQASTYAPIQLEVNKGLSNLRGSIAMARTNEANSATSQFFINVVDNVFLDTNGGGYAVFGQVITGMDIVDKIKVVPTTSKNGYTDVPATPVIITSVTRVY